RLLGAFFSTRARRLLSQQRTQPRHERNLIGAFTRLQHNWTSTRAATQFSGWIPVSSITLIHHFFRLPLSERRPLVAPRHTFFEPSVLGFQSFHARHQRCAHTAVIGTSLVKLALLIPCSRQSSGTGVPATA